MKTKLITTIMITLFLASMLSMAFVDPIEAEPGTVHIKAWIDGSDYLYIQYAGRIVWYVHEGCHFPGYLKDDRRDPDQYGPILTDYYADTEFYPANTHYPALPTTINGVNWVPVWLPNDDYDPVPWPNPGLWNPTPWPGDYPDLWGPNDGGERSSNTYESPSAVPIAWRITGLEIISARGTVQITQHPSSGNDWTAIVYFNDPQDFASWYEFKLHYRPPPAEATVYGYGWFISDDIFWYYGLYEVIDHKCYFLISATKTGGVWKGLGSFTDKDYPLTAILTVTGGEVDVSAPIYPYNTHGWWRLWGTAKVYRDRKWTVCYFGIDIVNGEHYTPDGPGLPGIDQFAIYISDIPFGLFPDFENAANAAWYLAWSGFLGLDGGDVKMIYN